MRAGLVRLTIAIIPIAITNRNKMAIGQGGVRRNGRRIAKGGTSERAVVVTVTLNAEGVAPLTFKDVIEGVQVA
jgi:hypothetical protein